MTLSNSAIIKGLTNSLEFNIPKPIYEEIMAHAQAGLPNESCGYLAGKDFQVQKFYPMINIDKSPEHFTFDPKEQFQVVKDARAEGLDLIGVYHSHPETPARLSAEDVRLFNDPKMIYVIVSLMPNFEVMKAYRLEKKTEEDVTITQIEIVRK